MGDRKVPLPAPTPKNAGANSLKPDSKSKVYSLHPLPQALGRKAAAVKAQAEDERIVQKPAC